MSDFRFTKENIDACLNEVAKEYKRLNGRKTSAEIILIGGSSILVNYQFRASTTDVDALIEASSSIKEAINHVGDKLGLPTNWLNADFVRTNSYSQKIYQFSKYYKTFSNVLSVRTISAEYLIAMKLMAGRVYKNDMSDVVGIIAEHKSFDKNISLDDVKRATAELYGDYGKLPEKSRMFVEALYTNNDQDSLNYDDVLENERNNKRILLDFQDKYPGVLNENNLDEIIANAKDK